MQGCGLSRKGHGNEIKDTKEGKRLYLQTVKCLYLNCKAILQIACGYLSSVLAWMNFIEHDDSLSDVQTT